MTPHIKRASDPSGFSLVEVMVAISIFSLLMAMLTTTIVKGMQLSRSMGVRLDNINQGQLGMNAATKGLRTAILPEQLDDSCVACGDTALIRATPTSVTFYANLNNIGQRPSLMSYKIEPDPTNLTHGNLIQTTQAPTDLGAGQYNFCTPGPTCPVTSRVIARGLISPVDPVFGYYDFDGWLLTANPLTINDLARVNTIDITLKVQTNTVQTGAPTNTIVQRVTLSNANANANDLPQP